MSSVAIVGASSKREKFGNKSVRAHLDRGWTVYPVHPKETRIEGLAVVAELSLLPAAVDRVALYVPAVVGLGVLEAVATLVSPSGVAPELWVNPGSGSPELLARAAELGLEVHEACVLVDIGAEVWRY
jgi:uncharacterized protein